MGIFTRLSDILTSNLNALLDRVENPEVMLAQIIREMEEGLACARGHAATAIAAEHRIGRELEQHRAESERWKTKAREALLANREDLVRRALIRKKEHDDLVRGLGSQYTVALQRSEHVKTSLRALEARLAEARRKQRSLLARHRVARAQLELQSVACSGIPDPDTPAARFERLEHRLTELEDDLLARVEVNGLLGDLDREFDDLESKQDIDRELTELKRELGKA